MMVLLLVLVLVLLVLVSFCVGGVVVYAVVLVVMSDEFLLRLC